jgi:hypothetical protein
MILLQVRVAVIREEGSNGDREMSAAVYAAGMEPWDITMSDLIAGEEIFKVATKVTTRSNIRINSGCWCWLQSCKSKKSLCRCMHISAYCITPFIGC